jgi:amidase
LRARLILFTVLLVSACSRPTPDLSEATIADLHDQIQRGALSSESITAWYLDRIRRIDQAGPTLRSVIEINPDALTIARALDEEWQRSGPRGPLHGIPVLLKANIDTADRMKTSAGSLALIGHIPPQDAFVVQRLRDAGAVILGKANLSEWANFRSTRSSSGWSSAGGQTGNAYDPARSPCGSSSGSAVAVAANLTTVAVGTETDGSVVCPSGINGIVGIKPTLGLVSRTGIIPIAHSQDTAGPMARTVRDAALLLSAMVGRDPADTITADAPAIVPDFAASLAADGLAGRRIGVIRNYWGAGEQPDVDRVLEASIDSLREAGAVIVDDIELDTEGAGDFEYTVLLYEFKHDIAVYLERSNAPFKTLTELIAFNEANADRVMPVFDQDIFLAAEEKGSLAAEEYLEAVRESKRIMTSALDQALADNALDALIAPTNGPAWMIDHINGDTFSTSSSSYAAVSGYPNVTVPAGFARSVPIGLSFIGAPFSEQTLIEIAYAFEQATQQRRAPPL